MVEPGLESFTSPASSSHPSGEIRETDASRCRLFCLSLNAKVLSARNRMRRWVPPSTKKEKKKKISSSTGRAPYWTPQKLNYVSRCISRSVLLEMLGEAWLWCDYETLARYWNNPSLSTSDCNATTVCKIMSCSMLLATKRGSKGERHTPQYGYFPVDSVV